MNHSHISTLLKHIGEFQLAEQQKVKHTDVSEKSLNQLVSYVDIESEKMLVEGLLKITPNAGFLTEEETTSIRNEEQYWIIDPIDGTTNYLFGHTKFCISIALYENQKPVYAAVYVPADNELFSADATGAYLNGKKFTCSNRSLTDSLLATGFPYYNFNEMDAYLSLLNKLMKTTKGLRRMGSAAIDLAYMAYGRFDAFFELNLSPWDVAGGAYIVQQAGGIVSDFQGTQNFVFGTSIVAGNTEIHAELLQMIAAENF
ncbi:MAG: myo-inositol-1(or 4)-monophosphatase [Pseudoalteromonas distincta]|jgi:myo-inositol-1(or 4)-monophosphatase